MSKKWWGGGKEPVTGDAISYSLAPNVPNPFTGTTEISFYAPKSGNVKLDVFNVRGELVKTLVSGTVETGRHTITWNGVDEAGRSLPSGTYTYRLTAGTTVLTRAMILTK